MQFPLTGPRQLVQCSRESLSGSRSEHSELNAATSDYPLPCCPVPRDTADGWFAHLKRCEDFFAGIKESVGEFVTASVNFLYPAGTILKTEEQVESFAWVNEQVVLPAGLVLHPRGRRRLSRAPPYPQQPRRPSNFPSRVARPRVRAIGEEPFNGAVASFTFTHSTAEDLADLRVGVVC